MVGGFKLEWGNTGRLESMFTSPDLSSAAFVLQRQVGKVLGKVWDGRQIGRVHNEPEKAAAWMWVTLWAEEQGGDATEPERQQLVEKSQSQLQSFGTSRPHSSRELVSPVEGLHKAGELVELLAQARGHQARTNEHNVAVVLTASQRVGRRGWAGKKKRNKRKSSLCARLTLVTSVAESGGTKSRTGRETCDSVKPAGYDWPGTMVTTVVCAATQAHKSARIATRTAILLIGPTTNAIVGI
jgi:hypothetical protein